MQNYRFKFVEKAALFVALILSTAFSLSVAAQRPSYPINRRIEEINRQSAENERDAMNRDLRGDSRKTENSKQRQALREQIKKDFEGIQAEYNKIVLNLKPNADVSREFLIEAAGNVRERAARLKTNLALPETKDEKLKNAPEEKTESVRQALLALQTHLQFRHQSDFRNADRTRYRTIVPRAKRPRSDNSNQRQNQNRCREN
jgi:phytoene dehydrogenase-like protein